MVVAYKWKTARDEGEYERVLVGGIIHDLDGRSKICSRPAGQVPGRFGPARRARIALTVPKRGSDRRSRSYNLRPTNDYRMARRLLPGIVAVLIVVVGIVVVSAVSVFFIPISSRTVQLPAVIVFFGPEPFRPALRPSVVATVWPALSWILIAVGVGIATRNTSRRRTFGYAAVAALAWLSWQEALAIHYIASDWRRGKDSDLQERILAETPVGSSMSQVEQVIRSEGWKVIRVDRERGFLDQRETTKRPDFNFPVVGVMHIEADAGDVQGVPFRSNVTVFWGFDRDGKLIDAWAWRTTDGW